jgi:hypothetical protein
MAKASKQNGKPADKKTRLAELNTEARRLKDRVKRMRASLPQLHVAADELRKNAYDWLSAIRARIQALYLEVERVRVNTRSDTVLGRVLDPVQLTQVVRGLEVAYCEVDCLEVKDFVPAIPPLLTHVQITCKQHPLAIEGAKLFGEPEATS